MASTEGSFTSGRAHPARRAVLAAAVVLAAAASFVAAAPEGAQVVRGKVNIDTRGADTVIRAGHNSIINYSRFNVAAGERVRFVQPGRRARV